MKGMNKVFLLGHVGQDPVIKTIGKDQTIANFSLATAEWRKDGKGNGHEEAEWHRLSAFGHLAEIIRDHVHKGSHIFIEGKLRTRSWEDNGVTRYTTEIVVNEITLIGSKDRQPSARSEEYAGKF